MEFMAFFVFIFMIIILVMMFIIIFFVIRPILKIIMRSLKENTQQKNEFNFLNYFRSLPQDVQQGFLNSLDQEHQNIFMQMLQQQQMQQQILNQEMQNQLLHQFNQWAMNENIKAGTPLDHGGYMQGPGFNPSETMHHEHLQQQIHQHHTDHMQMHNHFHNF